MSGIFGLFNLDDRPVEAGELGDMASLLARRGPDRTGTWRSGSTGLGHTLLATTPEALLEHLPLEHRASGCVITADVRLDNRPELLAALNLHERAEVTGDAEIVLTAYLEWGEACVQRLLGDFAFAIWDPRHHSLYCARDHMGMRQLIYHHNPRRIFVFATEPRAILVLPQTPYRVNEARIADYFVGELEGIDKTSTFFEDVYRLPPAHTMTVTRDGMRQRRYWKLEAGPELSLPSDGAYAEAFLDVFTEAVRARLRTVGPAGSMLSGGIDSGSVTAVARRLLAEEGCGPLFTFSAISPDGNADAETCTINAALTMDGLEPTTVSFGGLDGRRPELERLTRNVDDPFDARMALIRAIYLAGHHRGLKMLLDGLGGDVALSEGRHLARMLRAGRWREAYREARAQNRFAGGVYPPGREVIGSARAAFVPDALLRHGRRVRARRQAQRTIRASLVDSDLARRVDLLERLQRIPRSRAARPLSAGGLERADELDQPYVTVARERYDRVAASVAIEPRDPFSDVRLLQFCARIPDDQVSMGGWPKLILRRSMAGRLPAAVRWRVGKQHLGWAFTKAIVGGDEALFERELVASHGVLRRYVDARALESLESQHQKGDDSRVANVYHLVFLSRWLQFNEKRPRGEVDDVAV